MKNDVQGSRAQRHAIAQGNIKFTRDRIDELDAAIPKPNASASANEAFYNSVMGCAENVPLLSSMIAAVKYNNSGRRFKQAADKLEQVNNIAAALKDPTHATALLNKMAAILDDNKRYATFANLLRLGLKVPANNNQLSKEAQDFLNSHFRSLSDKHIVEFRSLDKTKSKQKKVQEKDAPLMGFIESNIGTLVLPIQGKINSEENTNQIADTAAKLAGNHGAKRFFIETPDGAFLDTIEIRNKQEQAKPISQQKYAVFFNGNGAHQERMLSTRVQFASEQGKNVVSFDLRSVGDSVKEPQGAQDLITDGIVQIQRLLDDGVDPGNIEINGTSLGATVAVHVAAYFWSLTPPVPVHVLPDRTFSDSYRAGIGIISKPGKDEELTTGSGIGKSVVEYIGKGLIDTKWHFETDKAWKRIPDSHKQYVRVKAAKKGGTFSPASLQQAESSSPGEGVSWTMSPRRQEFLAVNPLDIISRRSTDKNAIEKDFKAKVKALNSERKAIKQEINNTVKNLSIFERLFVSLGLADVTQMRQTREAAARKEQVETQLLGVKWWKDKFSTDFQQGQDIGSFVNQKRTEMQNFVPYELLEKDRVISKFAQLSQAWSGEIKEEKTKFKALDHKIAHLEKRPPSEANIAKINRLKQKRVEVARKIVKYKAQQFSVLNHDAHNVPKEALVAYAIEQKYLQHLPENEQQQYRDYSFAKHYQAFQDNQRNVASPSKLTVESIRSLQALQDIPFSNQSTLNSKIADCIKEMKKDPTADHNKRVVDIFEWALVKGKPQGNQQDAIRLIIELLNAYAKNPNHLDAHPYRIEGFEQFIKNAEQKRAKEQPATKPRAVTFKDTKSVKDTSHKENVPVVESKKDKGKKRME